MWETSSGTWTITREHLAAAIEAHKAGVVRKPVIKLGHEGPMRDASPALGYVDGLRLADAGGTLVGDLTNVPTPVANLLPHAYPSRSVEMWLDYEAPDGRLWGCVLVGLALLGATGPGVESLASLQDVARLYGVDGLAASAHRIVVAASTFAQPPDDGRKRAVAVAAARRRRTNRTIGV